MLSISRGYDPGYLTKQVARGAEGYYLSAAGAGGGEPPGRWTGRGCAELGLSGLVDPDVMTPLYAHLIDPRDPAGTATLGKAPRRYKSVEQIAQEMLDTEPDASPERVEQIYAEAVRKSRSAVMFFDLTFSPSKSVSLLHAGFQAAAMEARQRGDLEAAAEMDAKAEAVWAAVRAGSAASLDYLQDVAGYTRTGYHGAIPRDPVTGRQLADHATGRYEDAHDWIIASFDQHTSRENDPQLHIHNAVLNRVKSPDGEYRTLDSRAIHKARTAAGAIGERVMEEQLTRDLGVQWAMRPDGKSREIVGISDETREAFSARRVTIRREVAELVEAYKAKHGVEPSRRAVFAMSQFVTVDSRAGKASGPAPSRQEMLARWEAQATAAEVGALSSIPEQVTGRVDVDQAAALDALAEAEARRVLQAAVAEVEAEHATWSRHQLTAAINRYLPDSLGGLPAETVRGLLVELTDEALAPGAGLGIHRLDAPSLVAEPAEWLREDGTSIYAPRDRARYATVRQLHAEDRLTRVASEIGAPSIDTARAAEALGGTVTGLESLLTGSVPGTNQAGEAAHQSGTGPTESGTDPVQGVNRADTEAHQTGTAPSTAGTNPAQGGTASAVASHQTGTAAWRGGLRDDQAAAVYGVLTSGRRIDVLIGPAGAGKSRAMGELSDLWREQVGGRVVGLAVSQNAAEVLAGEGCTDTANVAKFLTEARAGRSRLRAGDLVVVDEASMITSGQLAEIEVIAEHAGAKLLLTGDPEQLAAVGDAGAMAMLARDHGYYQLTQVQRMREAWERDASLALRRGEVEALHAYDARGRLLEGSAEEMTESAYRRWLADHLAGKSSMLLAASNDEARELAGRARAELVELGLVEAEGVTIREGQTAGVGDLVMARRNDRHITDAEGRRVTNRDVLQIAEWVRSADPDYAEPIAARVRRHLGTDETGATQWSEPYEVTTGYMAEHAELAYASTVHAAQGRTVDTCHSVVRPGIGRSMLYVMMTRGREGNYAYTVAEQPAADLDPRAAAAPEVAEAERRAAREAAGVPTAGEAVHAAAPTDRDRFAILADALETDEAELTATEVLRDEHLRVTHLGHLGVLWTEATRQASARQVDALLSEVLTPDQFDRYTDRAETGPRSTLHRLVRAAELSGHDAAELVREAVTSRALDEDGNRADSIAKVLHHRIVRELGTDAPQPLPTTSYLERTPQAVEGPGAGLLDYARRVAEVMDSRVRELGEQIAERLPEWAARHLGQVPADPIERAEWEHRAGRVQAFREQYDRLDDRQALGHCPDTPEARAAWHSAYDALGRPGETRELEGMSTGELLRVMHDWSWQAWQAPVPVHEELRAVTIAEADQRAELELARRRAEAETDPQRRAALVAEAEQREGLVSLLTSERITFERLHEARETHVEHTRDKRDRAAAAAAIVREREGDDVVLPPLDPPSLAAGVALDAEVRGEAAQSERETEVEQREEIEGQLALDLAAAADEGRERDAEAEARRAREQAEREAAAAELEAERQAAAEARERETAQAQGELDLGLTVIGDDGHRARDSMIALTARASISIAQAEREAGQQRAQAEAEREEHEQAVALRAAAAVRQEPQRRREDEQARSINLDDDAPTRSLI